MHPAPSDAPVVPSATLLAQAQAARRAAAALAMTGSTQRDDALRRMAASLRGRAEAILEANHRDLRESRAAGASNALLDRLALSASRVEAMACGLEEVALLADPLGEGEAWTRPNGLQITRVRVPLGVIGIIYEARPNVTVEATSLAFKAGNAVLLRGSSSALASNRALVEAMRASLAAAGIGPDAVQLVDSADRDVIDAMVSLHGLLDVVIPRGGDALIQRVVQHARVPVIETGVGNCHVYVDARANLDMARRIIVNAKAQRPAVCNAAESLLVHQDVAQAFLPAAGQALREAGVHLRACPRALPWLPDAQAASEEDWGREFLDLILAVRVVDSLDEAIRHVNSYGTHHSDAIVTEDYGAARRFVREVDSAAVYVNASTRFTDGGQFGYGGELGISTQKLHARGPLGVRALTTCKYVVLGEGQIRD